MTAQTLGPYQRLFQRAAEQHRPLSALVELTNACNVDCEHCYLDLVPDKKIGALDTEEWKRVFREIAAEGCLFLTLSGGELLVRKDWFELAEYARSIGFALRLYTNGTLVDDDAADKIASLSPLGVEISILGADAATHDAVTRRRKSFDKTIDGIKRLRARGVPVLMKTVLMKRNAGAREAIAELAASLGCDVYFDLEVTPKNDGSREPTDLALDGDELARTAAAVLASAPDPKGFDRASALNDAPCAAGRRTCHIGPTGDLFPCTQWTKPVGNLRATSFRELWWGSETLAAVRAKTVGSFSICASCELLEVCTPCMALSLLENGNLEGPSPTKCKTALARARAKGIAGMPAGLTEGADVPAPPATLVQLRVPRRKAG